MTSTLHSSHDAAQGDDDTTVDEGTHLLLAASSTSSTISETSTNNTRQHALNILLSTILSRLGSKTWEFATPLLLLEWSPGSLAAPAALGLTRALFQTLVSPHLGKMADQHWNRMSTVWIGTSMQAVGCLMSVCVLLLYNFSINVDGSNASMMHLLSLLLVIAAGVIESLGAQLSSVAVKKEWLPIIFSEEEVNVSVMPAERNKKKMNTRIFSMLNIPNPITLSFINTTMTNIDLIAKMFGPVLAGWVLEVLAHNDGSMQRGFVFIATTNVVSFVPEIYLLRKVYQSCLALQLRCVDDDVNSMNQQKQTNSSIKKDDVSPWIIWINHPSGLPLLTLSLASLYMTALAPDGVVLTSYLVTIGMSPTSIGAFRGIGAVSGVLGICLFSLLRNNYDDENESNNSEGQQSMLVKSIERLRRLSLAFLLLEVVTILVAAAAFVKCDTTSIEKNESWQIYIFLGSIVVSRAGLYSFDVGVLEIEQWIVDERFRNAVGSVEGALCSLCEMGMYVLSIALPNPSQFGVQVGVSASAVSFGSICFGLFLCSYHMHLHHHHDDEDEYHDHNHSHGHHHNHHHHRHTLQQERDLAKQNGYHVHLHRHNGT